MQFLLHDVVIVLADGIVGKALYGRLGGVVEGYADDALHAGHQQTGIKALVLVVLHILHRGMTTLTEPVAEGAGRLLIHGLSLGDATGRKAEAQCLGFDSMG